MYYLLLGKNPMIRVENPSGGGKGNGYIPELVADPVPLVAEQAWVLKSGGGGGAVTGGGTLQAIVGLSMYMTTVGTHGAGGALVYQFSYRTLEGTTKRATIS